MNNRRKSTARPLAEFAGVLLADAFARQGFTSVELVTHWADIVGEEISAHAEPVKLQWPRRSGIDPPKPCTLVLRVEGPVAIEIQHLAPVIIERVNRFFGWLAVDRVSIKQAPLARRPAAKPPPAPDPELTARLAATMTDIQDEALRQALARLGAAVKSS